MIVQLLAFLFVAGIGIGLCFFGYRIFLVLLPILGFFAGLWLGAFGVSAFLGGGLLATTTGWIVGVILGVAGIVLSYYFFLAGVALVAAAAGAALSYGLMTAFINPGWIVSIVTVIVAVLAAVVTLRHELQKYVITFLTAVAGADLLVLSVLVLFGVIGLADVQAGGNLIKFITATSWLAWGAWFILAIAGVVFQVRFNKDYEFTQDRYVEGWG
jgi:hypothetical protein